MAVFLPAGGIRAAVRDLVRLDRVGGWGPGGESSGAGVPPDRCSATAYATAFLKDMAAGALLGGELGGRVPAR
jgi:hypothetical protein